jgi:hypothetical protein
MSELERQLTALAAEIEWPVTPPFELRLEPAAVVPERRRRRRALVLALAAVLVAIGIAFAVPPARSALLDLFRIGGVEVERVTTLPAAEERALSARLGLPVSRTEAEALLGGRVALPASAGEPQLYELDGFVSAVLATPEPVLVSQFRPSSGGSLLKKTTASSTVEHVRIDDDAEGLWIAGSRHVVFWPEAPPRLAGNVLLWEDRDGVTYRIEGKNLTRERALELAREMR